MSETNMPFGITKEEILELAAQKLVDEHGDYDHLRSLVEVQMKERIELAVKTSVLSKVDKFLTDEMERIVATEICPVNIWGEKTGIPTTLKGALADHAMKFWMTAVDANGKPCDGYYGKPRHEHIFNKIVGEEFRKAVEQNITNIVGAFKDAIKIDSASFIAQHIDSVIKVKTK